METGVVLELTGTQAVVLDGGGSFRQVTARAHWQVGDTVPLPPTKRRTRRRLMAVLAACLVLVFCVGTAGAYLAPAGLVSVDSQPSVELTVNLFGRVVSATARNQLGEELLAAVPVRYRPCDQVVAELLAAGGGTHAAVTIEGAESLAQTVTVAAGALADCHRVDQATVAAAHGCGMTAGRYLALQTLEETAPQTDWSGYQDHSLEDIVEETNRCHTQQTGGNGSGYGGGNGNGYGNGGGHHGNGHR